MDVIRVLVLENGKIPYLKEVAADTATLEQLVGGELVESPLMRAIIRNIVAVSGKDSSGELNEHFATLNGTVFITRKRDDVFIGLDEFDVTLANVYLKTLN